MILSIITINYNNASGLRKTMESVLSQTSKEFEYIVVDGASTDFSSRVISQQLAVSSNQSAVDSTQMVGEGIVNGINVRWVSEKDTGIYNAMNKGIRMATGEYVQFLNSGDWLVDVSVVENMIKTLPTECDILIGNIISVKQNGKIKYNRNIEEVSFLTFYRSTLQHTSAYIRKELFDKYGNYDETLKIVSDWKWYLIAVGLNAAKVIFANIHVSFFDSNGISNTNKTLEKAERRKVLEELIPAPILADYDRYYFDIDQMERIKKHPILYGLFWFIERCLFKLEKWRIKYCNWKKNKFL
jgi:glycosyltransferase involved in cell wall biosynthesis